MSTITKSPVPKSPPAPSEANPYRYGWRYVRTTRQDGTEAIEQVRGWIWLAPVRLWLGQTHDRVGGFARLACFDPETGEEVGDYTALTEDRDEARALARAEHQRAEAEAKARIKAEARVRELEAALERLSRRKR